ncbi:putative membrane protein [Chondromyces apiculatus DSM 436]|uniref:Putative membrane protein n=2 Tax=Chondromyces apiculatus TaxID=51 RepID=A0A017SYC7_9BACT|nr:putative membrane protein [Chondromyces apiculatus DSM 436]
METALDDLPWGERDLAPSLGKVYLHVQAKTLETIAWYMARKNVRAVLSQVLRFLAILFVTLGGLIPLIRVADLNAEWISPEMGQLGYVGFALAAGCVAIDRFFGLSTAWMRYIGSAFALQRALAEFQIDWALLQVKLGGKPPTRLQAEQMLLRLKEMRTSVLQVVEKETQGWVAEFQSSLAELYRVSRSQTDATSPGVIELVVSNGLDVDGEISVHVDGSLRERFRGTRTQIPGVAVGHHVVMIRGELRGVWVETMGTTMVPPGSVGTLTMTLAVPPAEPATSAPADAETC